MSGTQEMSGYSADSTFHERQLMKDPTTASSRIFVGSIPHENVSRKDVEDVFARFGKVTGVLLNRGFGFVQFDEERSATEAITSSDIMLKGRRLDVKQARVFRDKGRDFRDDRDRDGRDVYWDDRDRERERERDRDRDRHPERESFRDDRERDVYRDRSPLDDRVRDRRERDDRDWRGRERERYESFGKTPLERDRFFDTGRDRYPRDIDYRDTRSAPERFSSGAGYRGDLPDARSLPIQAPNMDRTNDCEIIVINKKQTRYAELIEARLKKLGLTVDILFPNEDVQMGRVLANISSRGSLYAIMVEPSNEDHRSLTLNILHGVPEAHRNMPIDDAINLIGRNFEAYQAHRTEKPSARPNPIPVVPAGRPTIIVQERHPESIQVLLNLLVDNRTLTVLQYDKVIQYLKERREVQVQIELGDSNDITPKVPSPVKVPMLDKQAELQNRILSILSAKSAAPATVPTSSVAAPVVVATAIPASIPLAVPAPVAAPVASVSSVSLAAPPAMSISSSVSNSLSSLSTFSNLTSVSATGWNPSQPHSVSSTSTPILNDPTVQKALDSLMQGNLLQRLVGGVSSASNSSQPLSVLGSAPSQPLFGAYANPTSNSSSNHVGGRRF